jgi:hypothetical protein
VGGTFRPEGDRREATRRARFSNAQALITAERDGYYS